MESQRFVGQVLVARGALPAERLDELLKTADEKNVALLASSSELRELCSKMLSRLG